MPWVRFTASFDWKPTRQTTIAFRDGDEKLVTTACANAAVGASKAVKVTKRKAKTDG